MRQKQKNKKTSLPPASRGAKGLSVTDTRRRTTLALAIGVIGFLLYANTFSLGYVLDDFSAIKENNIVRQGTSAIPEIFKTSYRQGYLSVKDGLYRPLSLAMFAVEWEYFPDQPGISHFVNVILYALTGFLLFMTLSLLFDKTAMGRRTGEAVALIATLFFIVHPLHAEVVANIKSRDEILCFLFVTGSLNLALRYVDEMKKRYLLYSLVCLFLSFLSKETAITYLAILPLALHFFRRMDPKKIIVTMIPFVVVTGICLAIRSAVLQGFSDNDVSIADNLIVGARTFSTRMGTAFYILGLYVAKLIYPHPLSYDYSFNQIPIVGLDNIFTIVSILFYCFIGGYALLVLIRSLKNPLASAESPASPFLTMFHSQYAIFMSFSIFVFLVTIFLFSNLVLIIGTSMGDRLMYFPSLGFCLAAATLAVSGLRITSVELQPAAFLKPGWILVFAITGFFSFLTWSRNPDWKDNYTLYSHDVKLVPNSVKAHYYLGLELIKTVAEKEPDPVKKKKFYEEGIAELESAVKILPSFSSAFTQMGVAYYHLENFEKAIENYNKAAALHPSDAITLNNIGTIYFKWQKFPEAQEKFEQALAIDPRFVDAYMNLGSVHGTQNRFDKAIESFQHAVRFAPDNANAHFFLAVTYEKMGDKANAEKYFKEAERINPLLTRK